MSEFQSLITGTIAGALLKAGQPDGGHLLIDVEVPVDEDGNYRHEVFVTGKESGEKLKVTVAMVALALAADRLEIRDELTLDIRKEEE